MKKIIIIAMALIISVSVVAQIKFSVKAGGNASYLSGLDMGDGHGVSGSGDFAFGFHAGGYANYSFSNLLGVQAEAIFSMQGEKCENRMEGSDTKDGVFRLNYINIPLLLDIKPFKKMPLSFLVGPQFGFCVNRSFIDGRVRHENDYKDFDFAIAWGLQYALRNHLTLGFRHNIGLTPSLKYDYEGEFEGVLEKRTVTGERNNVFHLSLGWTF